jgi:hypothetical protein
MSRLNDLSYGRSTHRRRDRILRKKVGITAGYHSALGGIDRKDNRPQQDLADCQFGQDFGANDKVGNLYRSFRNIRFKSYKSSLTCHWVSGTPEALAFGHQTLEQGGEREIVAVQPLEFT